MTLTPLHLALVAIGGALGGLARHLVSLAIARRFGEAFPWATLAVNVSGAAAIGALAALWLEEGGPAPGALPLWAGLAVGVLGSYTTVSTFALQTLALLRRGLVGRAAANVAASTALCLGACALAHAGARAWLAAAAP